MCCAFIINAAIFLVILLSFEGKLENILNLVFVMHMFIDFVHM